MKQVENNSLRARQKEIIQSLGTNPLLADDEALKADLTKRIDFIKKIVQASGASSLVLGISGGVDSLVAGRLCQLSAEQLREEGKEVQFIAVRLPYKEQQDEVDANLSLFWIEPDQIQTVNIAETVDAMMNSLGPAQKCNDVARVDFVKGNVKARARMIAQYAIANLNNGLVVGTDHAAEAVMGFFTKFGDGASDLAPLSGLVKSQVRRAALLLGAPEKLALKTPTADLEELDPGKPDEMAYGCTYEQIDAFLLGEYIDPDIARMIVSQFDKTRHKRAMPHTPLL